MFRNLRLARAVAQGTGARKGRLSSALSLSSEHQKEKGMKMPIRALLAGTAAIALMAGAVAIAPQAHAQTEMQPPQQEAPAVNYDQQTLETYAAAMTDVVEIGERKQPEISEAANEEEAEESWGEMQEGRVGGVAGKGMRGEEAKERSQRGQMRRERGT